ncbi:MAG: tRNA (adenosine(37)-N6)-threonylcarbamoyltransferase complex ATPase subunit type 1 TsaE [Candidatus Saccharimonadales bacterium]
MIINTESEMKSFGEKIAEALSYPVTIELIGDVGAGKTTLVKGIAKGLGVEEEISSPSFTLSKSYGVPEKGAVLHHYDFYRLGDPGIMSEELLENVNDDKAITIVEWGESVEGVLPKDRMKVYVRYRDDGSREVEVVR